MKQKSDARVPLTEAVATNGFPFEIKKAPAYPYEAMSEEMILQKLEQSRKRASQGMYRDADEVVADIRDKYGL